MIRLFSPHFICVLVSMFLLQQVAAGSAHTRKRVVTPKIMIISMWPPEAEIWHFGFPGEGLGNLSAVMVATPGLSMLYPFVFCTDDEGVCQITVGEGEINAASSMMALVLSRKFDLRRTYFLFAGTAGVSPKHSTIGGVAIAKYAVQVGLQYEIDSRDLPSDWPTGYIGYGCAKPFEYPIINYGTEVFELNGELRDLAYSLAKEADLADTRGASEYRSKYSDMGNAYKVGTQSPSVVRCDCATSDVYFSGVRLAEAFENTTRLWTNGSAEYCMSAQEENATLEVMVRAAIEGLVDFSRVIVMRSAANFDRAPPTIPDWEHLTAVDQNALYISLDNLYSAGIRIVAGILRDWNCTYRAGITPSHYVGDIFGSLGGDPDFGYGSINGGERILPGGASGHLVTARGPKARRGLESRWLR